MAIDKFSDIKSHAEAMKSGFGTRNAQFKNYEDIYLLNPGSLPSQEWIKQTISPDGRNSVLGAKRLMTAADPTWEVPVGTNDNETKKISSQVERACATIWTAAGRVRRKPLHYDVVTSALLYDEIHISITTTESIVARATKAQKARAEMVAKRTPLLFEVINPQLGYPEFDSMGLAAYKADQQKTVGQIIAIFGAEAEKQLAGKKSTEEVEFNEYFDVEYHCVWITGQSKPLLLEEHKLPMIPIVAQTVEGSDLFDIEDSRQPFLYTLKKSNIWDRQNLMGTVMFSLMFAIGSNPMFVAKMQDPSADIEPDFSTPGGVIKLGQGEDFGMLAKQAISAEMMELWKLAEQKGVESTMYRQTLGEPLTGNAPFSMVSLLAQSGRLPLIGTQRMAGWAIADAMYTGLQLLKAGGQGLKLSDKKGAVELKAKDIPEVFDLNCKLDITMPQDERQNAVIANEVVKGRLSSRRNAAEKYLSNGQYDDTLDEIWTEEFADLRHQQEMAKYLQQLQMAMQQAMTPPQPGMPQQGMPPQGGQQMPPQMMQGAPQGMPPEMMQQMGGQIPPEVMAQMQQQGGMPGQAPEMGQGLPMMGPQPTDGMPQDGSLPPDMMMGGGGLPNGY